MSKESKSGDQPWIKHPIDLPMDARIILNTRATVKSVRTLLEQGIVPGVYSDLIDGSGAIREGIKPLLEEMITERTPNMQILSSRLTMPLMFFAPNWLLRIVASL